MWGVKGHAAQRSWCWRVKSNLWTDGQTDRQTEGDVEGKEEESGYVFLPLFVLGSGSDGGNSENESE